VIVALCPLPNAWDTAANLARIDTLLSEAAAAGAPLAALPECGTTGFRARHDLSEDSTRELMSRLQSLAARHHIALFAPLTWIDRFGRPRNRALLIAADGAVLRLFEKATPTPSERRYFTSTAVQRDRCFTLEDQRFAVLFCIELMDAATQHFDGPIDAVLWPGYWGFEEPFDWARPGKEGAHDQLRAHARTWNAAILQINFVRPADAVPSEQGTWLGGQLVVDARGALLARHDPLAAAPLLVTLPDRA
jgi:predicted amidohydrolase